MTSHWDAIDEAAAREGQAKYNAFHSAGIGIKASRGGVWRTTRGAGAGAARPPASKGFSDQAPGEPKAA
jgi:hypothetical protein